MPFHALVAAALLAALPPGVDPALFPGADTRDPVEIQLAGLAQLYPGHILLKPQQDLKVGSLGRLPYEVTLRRGNSDVTYLRIYDLKVSKAKLVESLNNPVVIIDLRYVFADVTDSKDFADALAKAGLASESVHNAGNFANPTDLPAPSAPDKVVPLVLVIVNGETAGPLEAWLAAFQSKQSILAVGMPTAGQPGEYKQATDHDGFYILQGELQPESGSIAGTGLKPAFPVAVTPEQDYLAYQRFENNPSDASAMLRHEKTSSAVAPAPVQSSATAAANSTTTSQSQSTQTATTTDEPGDPVLQHAMDVIAALQVLNRVPKLPPAAKPAGTTAATATSEQTKN